MLDRGDEYDRMAQCEQALWWYQALHERTAQAIGRWGAAGRPLRMLDAGCGTGGLMRYLQERQLGEIEGFDLSAQAVGYCEARGLQARQLDLKDMARHYAGRRFDVIVSNDTLCYLNAEEREAFVAGARSLLEPGGLLVFNLPALAAFGGIHDKAVGIGKRFDRQDIRGMRAMEGMVEETSAYWPFLLSPLIFAVRATQRLRLALGLVKEVHSDVAMPPAGVNSLLLALCRWERKALRSGLFGSSLFVVLRRR